MLMHVYILRNCILNFYTPACTLNLNMHNQYNLAHTCVCLIKNVMLSYYLCIFKLYICAKLTVVYFLVLKIYVVVLNVAGLAEITLHFLGYISASKDGIIIVFIM